MGGLAARSWVLAALALSACSQVQSALSPEGDTARSIAGLFWFFTIVCAVVWLIVMLLQIARFGLAGLMIYVGIVAGIFGSAYVVTQLLGV